VPVGVEVVQPLWASVDVSSPVPVQIIDWDAVPHEHMLEVAVWVPVTTTLVLVDAP